IAATDKNYFIYRDTHGTGEWQMIPWDLALTFGPNALNTDRIEATDDNPTDHSSYPFLGSLQFPFHGRKNHLFNAIFTHERTREMFLRRLRTLMDELLDPAERHYENRIDELVAQLAPDVLLDKARWGGNTHFGSTDYTLQEATARIKNEYLGPRRTHLFSNHSIHNPGYPNNAGIPDAQTGNPTIQFGSLVFNPSSGNQDEEYLQLLNTNPFAVDISGWQLTGGVETTFQPGTVIPAGDTLYISPSVTAFRGRATAPTGGMGLFVQGYNGHLSNFGETITLVAADGQTVAQKSYQGSPSPQQLHLRVTELNYNPHPADLALGELDVDPDEFEFIELINTSDTETLDLGGVRFTDGVIFDFTTAAAGPTLLAAGFDAGAEGFTYADDAFNGTNSGSLASGNYDSSGGLTGGGLHVKLGPHTSGNPTSGAWSETFQLTEPITVDVSLQFRMILGTGCEADEFGEVILEVDGIRYGSGPNDSLVYLNGDGSTGENDDTGWMSASFTVPLAAGNHTITVGAYNNKQNSLSLNEYVEAFIDDVVVTEVITESPQLGPGQSVLVVSNRNAFESRYGTGLNVAGQFQEGRLDNNGERVKLDDLSGSTIVQIDYGDSSRWPGRADGKGASLVAVDTAGDYDDPDNWQSSVAYGGTPGGESLAEQGVVVNEVLSHTDWPQMDSIELHNVTDQPIDVAGWYLSDRWGWDPLVAGGGNDSYRKFRIPTGVPAETTIPPHGYLVFDEHDFNPTPLAPAPNHFALDGAGGDDVWLMRADAAGNLTHFGDHVDFGAQANGESWGRWPDGWEPAPDARGAFYPMTTSTLGEENSGPRLGAVVISEVHYNPGTMNPGTMPEADDLEFVEIYNGSSAAVDLSNWRLRKGVGFDFAAGDLLAPESAMVIVPFDPILEPDKTAAFQMAHGISGSIEIRGPYSGQLHDDGEPVQLRYPDEPPSDDPDFYPGLLADEVIYDDDGPWPLAADGTGASLHRGSIGAWGDDA
ncbi:MAG: lamin tail domain-containing protein, partial [Candidatus Nealsonbacteria bacterium]|nr:lamin tail domain-containing protein [Candidatus Nealsonbacteria bacterium]